MSTARTARSSSCSSGPARRRADRRRRTPGPTRHHGQPAGLRRRAPPRPSPSRASTTSRPPASLTFQCQLDVPETAPGRPARPRGRTRDSPRARTPSASAPSTPPERRRVAGRLHLDDRPDGARDRHQQRPRARPTNSTSASFNFTSPEPGVVVRVLARRRRVRELHLARRATPASPSAHTASRCGLVDAAGNIDGVAGDLPVDDPVRRRRSTAAPRRRCRRSPTRGSTRAAPSSNMGSDSILKVMSKSGNANLRALVRFNLPAIPAGLRPRRGDAAHVLAGSASSSQRTLQALRLNGLVDGERRHLGEPAGDDRLGRHDHLRHRLPPVERRGDRAEHVLERLEQRLPDQGRDREPGRRAAVPRAREGREPAAARPSPSSPLPERRRRATELLRPPPARRPPLPPAVGTCEVHEKTLTPASQRPHHQLARWRVADDTCVRRGPACPHPPDVRAACGDPTFPPRVALTPRRSRASMTAGPSGAW